MAATFEKINSVQHRITCVIPTETVDEAFGKVFRRLQKKVRLKGFRPGKAPLRIIQQFYGDSVAGDVADDLIQSSLRDALVEHEITPVAAPVVDAKEPPKKGEEYNFSAVVDVMPEVEVKDYKGVEVSLESFQVTDGTVDQEINRLRRRMAKAETIEDSDVKAESGQLATLSHSATMDGNPVEQLNVENIEVALGQDEIFDKLEEGIIGMGIGEERDIAVDLPADYPDPTFAGKSLQFKVALSKLQKLIIPELNDGFAKDVDFESVNELKQSTRRNLEEHVEKARKQKVEAEILKNLMERHAFDVPPSMVDQITDSMIRQMQWETDEEREKALHDEELRQRIRPDAQTRAKNTLLLFWIAKQEKLEPTQEELNEKADELMTQFGDLDGATKKSVRQRVLTQLSENYVFEKTVLFLVEHAKVTETQSAL